MRKPVASKRRRISPMGVLPVFFKLNGKTALIAGGSDDACWKAKLLHAAGAHLLVCAESLCPDFEKFLAGDIRYTYHARKWIERDFKNAALAIGGFETDKAAGEFTSAARMAGVPVNTIDKPATCDFQFGSIVNRNPVVVSISTDGAAPAIAQEIRRRIEACVPESIASWTSAAKELRKKIISLLPSGSERRAFWQSFAQAAFSNSPGEIHSTVERILSGANPEGRVTLVGAGPGAADLLTLRAQRALQSADIVLFDDLVSTEVLEFARREAKRMTVGKRGGRPSCKQDDINALMLRFAKAGKHVVRLKSGDPMIFGRGGEELEALEAAGVQVDVVPGITTALAAAAEMKTSLTHRQRAQGVKFVTGHSKKGALPELDWAACADGETTIMAYMAAGTASAMASRLISEGLSPDTPVVVASAVSRPDQNFTTLSLKALGDKTLDREAPTLVCIGDVFDLSRIERVRIASDMSQQGVFASVPEALYKHRPAEPATATA